MRKPFTRILPQRINIDEAVQNSFKDFHTKGFDYICVRRSPTETLKLYFFDGDVSKLPEVVNPHDHRYPFTTWIVDGRTQNSWYEENERGESYQRFCYDTPLNGGSGFKWNGTTSLLETKRMTYDPGGVYVMRHDEIHTIRMIENENVIFLQQFEDKVPIGHPTTTFTKSEQAPSLDGLYRRFTPDELIAKLKNFEERTGYVFQTEGFQP